VRSPLWGVRKSLPDKLHLCDLFPLLFSGVQMSVEPLLSYGFCSFNALVSHASFTVNTRAGDR